MAIFGGFTPKMVVSPPRGGGYATTDLDPTLDVHIENSWRRGFVTYSWGPLLIPHRDQKSLLSNFEF